MKKLLLIGGGTLLLLGAMVVGALFAIPMLASAKTSTNTNTTTTPTTAATNPYCEQYLQDLANRLHVSVSTLQGDKLAAAKDVIAQMVKDGKLTQSEANLLEQRLTNHQACTGKKSARVANALVVHALKGYQSDIESQVAQGLHLTPAQLKADLQSGQSLSQIATAQHVSASQLHTIVLNAIQSALNKAVAAKSITQQQATNFMQELQNHPQLLNRILHAHHKKAQPQSSSQS
jgi:polyhydroxyalkanoate synthesis regulator phasin